MMTQLIIDHLHHHPNYESGEESDGPDYACGNQHCANFGRGVSDHADHDDGGGVGDYHGDDDDVPSKATQDTQCFRLRKPSV